MFYTSKFYHGIQQYYNQKEAKLERKKVYHFVRVQNFTICFKYNVYLFIFIIFVRILIYFVERKFLFYLNHL